MGFTKRYYEGDVNDRVVSRGIILVSFNYRLGPLGFFSTGDESAPGNYGLWDQLQGLKFVNEIVSSFGGNPKRITVFGGSAGGASVSWLSYSPLAQGLFQKAIPMCGCSTIAWAQNSEGNHKSSVNFLNKTNCLQQENPKECLKKKSLDEIVAVEKVIIKLRVWTKMYIRFNFLKIK